MSSNLAPPQVFVDTPRPHNKGSNAADDFTGLISVSLSNFVGQRPKSPKPRKSLSPRVSPMASPRIKKK
ncbi:uncharacterized protein CELE_C33B4.4 [Caenorhabditis elegans]|uniref:Uncharacterized protein n=1 Tax=Caenorhabditis elegans TaxID=6239 RepID=Q7YX74_CAEEL|nr:Uncharacterized protein CELE_C33B4.4 [Caenorhabditis elegans]CAE17721.1 Uncharacterized protein CELE_C33B4.4 [Caenorhabditis elegans]|eukprot:NP_001022008.1 Uncharacterized protein CELE_C33B4.4 [Caenorhabditis elegans]